MTLNAWQLGLRHHYDSPMTDTDNNPESKFSRPIRSFVKRQGRMTPGQRRALDTLWPDCGIDYTGAALNETADFGRQAPLTLEIGFGNGDNLVEMAKQAPELNFLGIEVHEPGVGHCLIKIDERKLQNVRVMRHDAIEVLRNMIGDHSLARVNLFFPDPWPKKRHHKRRIVQRSFVELLSQKLLPGGIFHVATDWENYAEHIEALMQTCDGFQPMGRTPDDRSVSRFDSRGQRLGHRNWEKAWCTRSKFT
jgi:tRNA (guanine-N7-)-methyltransferase